MPINLDLEKNTEKSNEEDTDNQPEIKKSNNKNSLIVKENSNLNGKKTKLQKLEEFINRLNSEEEEIKVDKKEKKNASNNNEPLSQIKLPTESDIEEKMDQMLLSKSNSCLKEDEKIIYNANKYDLNNINLISNEFNKTENLDKNLTGSIMYINSNIDRNMHIKNGNENYGFHLNSNNNSKFDFADYDIEPPNNDQDFIDNLEIIKVSLTSQKINPKKEDDDLINNNSNSNNLNIEENEYEKKNNNEQFFKPLDNYENTFNLEQINPFQLLNINQK